MQAVLEHPVIHARRSRYACGGWKYGHGPVRPPYVRRINGLPDGE